MPFDAHQYYRELGKHATPIAMLKYTCLLHLDGEINTSTLLTLIHNLFVDDNYMDWLGDPQSIRHLAELICQRR